MTDKLSQQQISTPPRISSLYNRIIMIIGVILVTVAVFIAVIILLFVYKNENIFWHARQTEAVHNAAKQVDDYLEKNENILRWLEAFGFDEIQTDSGLFSSVLTENPAFMEIAFLDAQGNLLTSAAQGEPILASQFTVQQSQWFRAAKAGKKYYSRIQTSQKGESYLILAMPSRQNGVVVAQINMDGLWQEVAGITFGKSGSVYVVSQEGQIIAHQNSQLVVTNRTIANSTLFTAILQAPNNEYAGKSKNLNKVKVNNVSARIGSTGWIVIGELPRVEALAISRQALLFIPVVVLLLMTISAAIFKKLLAREFLRPVELLRNGALRLSQGDLAFRHTIPERKDELCQVMEGFNAMAEKLAERQIEQQRHAAEIDKAYGRIANELHEREKAEAALQKLNDELEQRIQERTNSLLQSNKDLLHEISERMLADQRRQKLEMQLQQAQKMEAIGTLAGGIAHDFNNILGAIIGNAEMARDEAQPASSQMENLDEVLKASDRAAELVKQILAFSRQSEAECIVLQPASIVRESLKMLRPSIPSTITIRQNVSSSSSLILADPTHIHQILINLCTNAFHAMERSGGKLEISLRDVELSEKDLEREQDVDPGRFVRLAISDSGSGIAPEVREKIFDPFFTTKAVGKGTGMGLSIVHGFVKNYRGFIRCNSQVGEGTTFEVYFPAINQEMSLGGDESTGTAPRGQERILLIDDEQMLAGMGKKMLEKLGYTVTMTTDSHFALEIFRENPDQFDIVITDQTMPGLTGVDLCRLLLTIRPDLPIILCTGYSSLITEEDAKAAGVREFALKPLTQKNISQLIRKIFDGPQDLG